MIKQSLSASLLAVAFLAIAGCASAPQDNAMVAEARRAVAAIENDPNVARSAATDLRSANKYLENAESLLAEDAETVKVEHAAYLARQHAMIAARKGEREALSKRINQAEETRRQIMLQNSNREAEALRRQMAALQAEKTERGMVLTLGDVLFDVNKADLKAASARTIDRLAEFMAEYPERRVRIEGYTDSTGDAGYNQQLSERRALAVRDALQARGIASSRIEYQGYGEQYPVVSNDTASGRQQNRRVEIVISDQDGRLQAR
ncbi:OmpA family protein [Marinobacter sp. X15-166B]|uniref:OmpA family protein n=1 Tax=Marinobacter sp. X15-166B TaxID=1897620 RepID=UPI00085CDC13|nr:OmpA family protein [Marinobacter sp. X15-166B]OEY65887.1 hypothetical protein BG841_05070 [Marinobacter sp. X15-166B]